jgi:hypothetical protein
MENVGSRNCQSCGDKLKGRIDKKFCDDYCRNNYNNRQKKAEGYNNLIRLINGTLLKNRRILESIITEETAKTHREKLLAMGFQFKYLTHTYLTRSGKLYSYCYDYGYLPIGNDWFLVVKKKGNEI